tara:strand:- start:666 stop:1469 length:804 start_codon:yes stop_codon:yes gene_type:complete
LKKESTLFIALLIVVLVSVGGLGVYVANIAQSKKEISKKDLKKIIDENPLYFAESFKGVMVALQKQEGEKRRRAELEKMEALFDKPLKPSIDKEAFLGPKNAPIVLVEYSDFECPYCSRSAETVKVLLKKYPGKIKFIYKHLPLKFHKNAMVAAQYFEAALLQDKKKAFDYHFKIFESQRTLQKGGEKFLKKLGKELGFDLGRLTRDANSGQVLLKIKSHVDEATKFDITGTPGFLVNGVPIKGAYPIEYFDHVINRLVEKNPALFK